MTTGSAGWEFRLVDSLEKVFPETPPRMVNRRIPLSALLGETMSLQLAFHPPASAEKLDDRIRLTVETSPPEVAVDISSVELVPCEFVAYPGHDDGYLRDLPGLYPDLLVPAPEGVVAPILGGWRAAWIDVRIDHAPGPVRLRLRAEHAGSGELLHADEVQVDVVDASLPALDIVNTHWLHADSLAQYYRVPVFSEPHWRAVDSFVGSAARMGANSLLVPAWTPPIDTEPGARRLPAQLVDIERDARGYRFGFERMGRWLDVLRRHGIRHLELPHLFTQWGAEAAPAIDGVVDGIPRQLFGWDTPATSPEYRAFLEALLPRLRRFLDDHWAGRRIFHVSDEPRAEHLEAYAAARAVVADLLDGELVVDALSDYAFYERGVVSHPVVATDQVEPFLQAGVDPLWVYFCLTQHRDVANRFIGMPSSRLRVLGRQLFAARATGFLHWGFNFYGSARSLRFVDPFTDASAGGTMPAGDPFVVYPGPEHTAWESIRHRVSAQAMNDHRALQLLRDRDGGDAARSHADPDGDLSFRTFSLDPDHHRATRARIDAAIATGSLRNPA